MIRETPAAHRLETALEPGSEEWLQTMSASKVAAIVGISPWKSAHQLWHEMAGTVAPEPQTDAMSRGHEFEPLIRGWYAAAHPDWEVHETSTWQSKIRPWQTADPDGLIVTDLGVEGLEIKTAIDMRDWADGVPNYYAVQAMWQCDTLGLDRVRFAVCGPFELFDRRPREFVVEYQADDAEWLRNRVNEFRMSLVMGIEPAPDFRLKGDREVLRHKHPRVEENPGIEVPDDTARPWLEALTALDAATEAEAVSRANLLAFLGNGKTARFCGTTIATRQSRGKLPFLQKAKGLNISQLLHPERKAA